MLGLQKRANIGELRKLLGPDLMRDFSIYWNLEETKNKTGAQKELSVSNPTLYKEVVESFKSYREAFVIDANKKYPNVERAIQTIFPRKQKECLEEIMKSKGSAFQTIVTVFAKYSGDTT